MLMKQYARNQLATRNPAAWFVGCRPAEVRRPRVVKMVLQQLVSLLCTGWATYDMVMDVPQNVGECPSYIERSAHVDANRGNEIIPISSMTSLCQLGYSNLTFELTTGIL